MSACGNSVAGDLWAGGCGSGGAEQQVFGVLSGTVCPLDPGRDPAVGDAVAGVLLYERLPI